jgi:hypothetical protein
MFSLHPPRTTKLPTRTSDADDNGTLRARFALHGSFPNFGLVVSFDHDSTLDTLMRNKIVGITENSGNIHDPRLRAPPDDPPPPSEGPKRPRRPVLWSEREIRSLPIKAYDDSRSLRISALARKRGRYCCIDCRIVGTELNRATKPPTLGGGMLIITKS